MVDAPCREHGPMRDNEHINQTVLARSVLVGKEGSSLWTIPTVRPWHWRFKSSPLGHFWTHNSMVRKGVS